MIYQEDDRRRHWVGHAWREYLHEDIKHLSGVKEDSRWTDRQWIKTVVTGSGP